MKHGNRFLMSVQICLTMLLLLSVSLCFGQVTPPQSTFFSTVAEEAYSTYQIPSGSGDLWPSCWADDGNLYAANGDGNNFSSSFHSMAVGKIAGTPPNLTGTFVAGDVGQNYAGSSYNDKPTGMLCVGGALYLAFQNLNTNFNDAPVASIVKSIDHGATWSANPSQPMFGSGNLNDPLAYRFTTIFFLDYGQNSGNAIDGYVYAYALDQNWRSETAVYLARVPSGSVLNRSTWQFYSGLSGSTPNWSSDITRKVAVITDTRLSYPTMFGTDCPAKVPVIAQGGVVYDQPLQRYLFTSWSCSTHELYEAPQPWGPWSHITSGGTTTTGVAAATTDFGPLRLTHNRGQYGTSIPSKFISSDGRSMYLQSNVCCGGDSYTFALRKLSFTLASTAAASNLPSGTNLASVAGTQAVSKSTHFGSLCGLNCSDQLNSGNLTASEDDFDEENKPADSVQSFWGYTWPQPYNFNQVVYQTGNAFSDGGYFASGLQVQVRQNAVWSNIPGFSTTPAYPYSSAANPQLTYTFNLPDTAGDGVRIIGTPGGASFFTSITHLGVYFKSGSTNLVADPGFELQTTNTVSNPWAIEGPDGHGIDRGLGFAHSGSNNSYIRDSSTNWNAITQTINVQTNTNYQLTGWVKNNFTTNLGYFGVRASDGTTVLKETSFSSLPGYTQLNVTFNSGSNSTVKVYVGFFGQSVDRFLQFDDVSLR